MPMKPLNPNSTLANTQQNSTSKVASLEKKKFCHNVDHQGFIGKENVGGERNIDLEIKEIEEEISRLCSRLECLRLEKAQNEAMMNTKMPNQLTSMEEMSPVFTKLKTPPRRGSSLGPMELTRGMGRRGLSLGPSELYSATKLKQWGKQEMKTPVQSISNRRKGFYWKLNEIDELRATKERGKRLSLSPKLQSTMVNVTKQAVTAIGYMKMRTKEDGLAPSIQPKKLFVKDPERSAIGKKSLKSGRKRGDGSINTKEVKELRKRSLPENEEDSKRFEKKRVSLDGETQEKGVDHKTPLSVSKILDKFPKIKTLRRVNESPRDSGAAKRVSELAGKKSYFKNDDVNDNKMDESF